MILTGLHVGPVTGKVTGGDSTVKEQRTGYVYCTNDSRVTE